MNAYYMDAPLTQEIWTAVGKPDVRAGEVLESDRGRHVRWVRVGLSEDDRH